MFKGKKLNKKIIISLACIGVLIISALTSGFNFFSNKNEQGKFVRVGNMHYARSGHKAVLLQDGRVLIVEGASEKVAEIYDPQKRKFYKTGSLNIPRDSITATLLNDGRVLIVGGNRKFFNIELYDPKTGKFEKGPELIYPRMYPTVNLLPDGRVLITGCYTRNKEGTYNYDLKTTEIYDPKTNKFEIGPNVNTPRYAHSSVSLPNGDVLLIGGVKKENNDFFILSSVEKYDFKNNKFVNFGNIQLARKGAKSLLLDNNKIFIYGGVNKEASRKISWPFGVLKNGEIFDINNQKSREIGVSSLVGEYPVLVKLPSGQILLTGGSTYRGLRGVKAFKKTEIFDPATNKFYEHIDMLKPHAAHTATILQDGNILITGGGETDKKFKYAELYIIPKSKKVKGAEL